MNDGCYGCEDINGCNRAVILNTEKCKKYKDDSIIPINNLAWMGRNSEFGEVYYEWDNSIKANVPKGKDEDKYLIYIDYERPDLFGLRESELDELIDGLQKAKQKLSKMKKDTHEKEDATRLAEMSERDFVIGRVFGIKGNVRKGIVIKREGDSVVWRWVTSEPRSGEFDLIKDMMDCIVWLGGIELENLNESER